MGTYNVAYIAAQYQVAPQRVYAARRALGMVTVHYGRVAMTEDEYHRVGLWLGTYAEQRAAMPSCGIVSCCGWTALRENNPAWRCPECGGRGA